MAEVYAILAHLSMREQENGEGVYAILAHLSMREQENGEGSTRSWRT